MADKVHQKTQEIVDDIKSGLHGIHGAGEVIRGGAMEALDGVFHKYDGEARNREIVDRGLAEMKGTDDRFEDRHHPQQGEVGHGFSHSQPESRGQGKHLANTNVRDAATDTEFDSNAAVVESGEGHSMRAARLAMQERNER